MNKVIMFFFLLIVPYVSMAWFTGSCDIGDFECYFEGNGTASIRRYIGSQVNVIIPDEVKIEYDKWEYDEGKSLWKTIHHQETALVANIGSSAFYNCTGLTSVTIPSSVTSIGEWAFRGCSGLTSVTIPSSVTSIGNYAFYGCSGLTSITIPSSVTSIGGRVFERCSGLKSVTIPEGVTSIGYNAFSGCSGLISITIPSSVTSIDVWAFQGCSGLVSITIPEGVTSIGESAFQGCSGLTSITIPEGVTSIGNYAFYGCSGLISITIPSSVTSIGVWAFRGCSGLTSITIPEGVTSIGESAFQGCSGLTSITIPEGVTSIGNDAFSGCSGLTSITIPEGVTSIGDYAFRGCSGLVSVTIPEGVMHIEPGTFFYCSSLTSVVIPEGVTSIGYGAFSHCSSLVSVTVPLSMMSIGEEAFLGCKSLLSVDMLSDEASVTPAPVGCASLLGIEMFSSADIGRLAFGYCYELTSVVIPKGVTSIGEEAFKDCCSLTSVEIPKSVTNIGSFAFSGSGLTSAMIPDGVMRIEPGTFYACLSLVHVEIPLSVTRIGEEAFKYCSSLENVEIPSSVMTIGKQAFEGCVLLTSATIHGGVMYIEESAFNNCLSLSRIEIPLGVVQLGDCAFWRCGSLRAISFMGPPPSAGIDCFARIHPDAIGYYSPGCEKEWKEALDKNGYWHGVKMVPSGSTPVTFKFWTGGWYWPSGEWGAWGCECDNEWHYNEETVWLQKGVHKVDFNVISGKDEYGVTRNWRAIFRKPKSRNITVVDPQLLFDNVFDVYPGDCHGSVAFEAVGLASQWDDINWTQEEIEAERAKRTLDVAKCSVRVWNNETGEYIDLPMGRSYYLSDGKYTVRGMYDGNFESGEWVYVGDPLVIDTRTLFSGSDFGRIKLSYIRADDLDSTFRCKFDVNAEDAVVDVPYMVVKNGTDFTHVLPTPRRPGYKFLGWFTKANGGKSIRSVMPFPVDLSELDLDMSSDDKTAFVFYAHWESWMKDVSFVENLTIRFKEVIGMSVSAFELALEDDGSVAFVGEMADGSSINVRSSIGQIVDDEAEIPLEWSDKSGAKINMVIRLSKSGKATIKDGVYMQDGMPINVELVQDVCLIVNDGVLLGCDGDVPDGYELVVPDEVTCIAPYAFWGCSSLASVTISKGVTSIGEGAFGSCDMLVSINVDSANAYYSSIDGVLYNKGETELICCPGGAKSVIIPSSVVSICNSAFQDCRGLTSVTILAGIMSIGDWTFGGCVGLTSVAIPSSVTSIGNCAFSSCHSLTSMTIPESVTSIGGYAFAYCSSLISVAISKSVMDIGEMAFDGCDSLATIYVEDGDGDRVKGLLEDSGFDVSQVEIKENGESKPDGGPCTQTVDGIEWTYTVSNGKVSVGGGSYNSLAIPQSTTGAITIPSTLGGCLVTSIGERAFSDCSGLTSVTIPEGVTSMGDSAFFGCSGLISVTIPSSVTSIGESAFWNCDMLTSINVNSSNAYYCSIDGVLYNKGVTELICCPGNAKSVIIPSSVTSIGALAFAGCTSLASITIPPNTTSIGNAAFGYCSALISVTIPSSITSIGYDVFYGCTELKTVYVSLGDAERVKGLMTDKGVDVSTLTFVEKSEVIADVAALKEAFGEESSVVRNLTSEEELIKFNEFLGKCGITTASQISDKQKQYAYESFRMSVITLEPQLFENEPKLKIHEFKQGEGGWSVSISLKAGGEEIAMAKKALEEHISVGNKLTEITAKPDIVASPSADGASLTFTITPPEGREAFIMLRL